MLKPTCIGNDRLEQFNLLTRIDVQQERAIKVHQSLAHIIRVQIDNWKSNSFFSVRR